MPALQVCKRRSIVPTLTSVDAAVGGGFVASRFRRHADGDAVHRQSLQRFGFIVSHERRSKELKWTADAAA